LLPDLRLVVVGREGVIMRQLEEDGLNISITFLSNARYDAVYAKQKR